MFSVMLSSIALFLVYGGDLALHNLAIEAARRGITAEQLIDLTLAKHNGKVWYAAEELGVSTEAIYARLRKRQRELQAVGK